MPCHCSDIIYTAVGPRKESPIVCPDSKCYASSTIGSCFFCSGDVGGIGLIGLARVGCSDSADWGAEANTE